MLLSGLGLVAIFDLVYLSSLIGMIYLFCEIDEIKDNIKNIKEEKEL
jgi:hypothetical protein